MTSAAVQTPDAPVLLGHKTPTGIAVWCPFCKLYHQHGVGDGHRAAHCDSGKGSPFNSSGYIIKLV